MLKAVAFKIGDQVRWKDHGDRVGTVAKIRDARTPDDRLRVWENNRLTARTEPLGMSIPACYLIQWPDQPEGHLYGYPEESLEPAS